MYITFNSICYNETENKATVYSSGTVYTMNWDTGLSSRRVIDKGCPVYCEAFENDFNKVLDKPFRYNV